MLPPAYIRLPISVISEITNETIFTTKLENRTITKIMIAIARIVPKIVKMFLPIE